MNIQELIEKYKKYEDGLFDIGAKVACQNFLKDLEQLDKPEKVTIPQFVADWIEECKLKKDLSLGGAIQLPCPEIYEWLIDWKNQELFARAWLDGYEADEEPKYTVKVKGISENNFLIHDKENECWLFEDNNNENSICTHHARKELEDAGFGWVFDCPGIEIEEVEG